VAEPTKEDIEALVEAIEDDVAQARDLVPPNAVT